MKYVIIHGLPSFGALALQQLLGLTPFGPLADAFHLFDSWDGLATWLNLFQQGVYIHLESL